MNCEIRCQKCSKSQLGKLVCKVNPDATGPIEFKCCGKLKCTVTYYNKDNIDIKIK